MQFNVKNFALAIGVVWALGQLIVGWGAAAGWGVDYVYVMSSIYVGYQATFLGGIIGGIWGFVDGVVFGAVFAYLYNTFNSVATTRRKRK